MIVVHGKDTKKNAEFGPGVEIHLTGNEVAQAIDAWRPEKCLCGAKDKDGDE